MGFLDDLKNIFSNKINTEIQTKTLHKIINYLLSTMTVYPVNQINVR